MFARVFSFFKTSFSYIWLVVLAIYFGVLAGQAVLRSYGTEQDTKTLQNQLLTAQQDNERLKALVVYYQTDNYKEKELRSELLLKMPGEKVYALPESSVTQAADDVVVNPATSTPVESLPDWQQWVQYLFNGPHSS